MQSVQIHTTGNGPLGGTSGVIVRADRVDVALIWPWPSTVRSGDPFWIRFVAAAGAPELWLTPFLVNVVSSPFASRNSKRLGLVTFGDPEDGFPPPTIAGASIPDFTTGYQRATIATALNQELRGVGGSWKDLLLAHDNNGVLAALRGTTSPPVAFAAAPSSAAPGPAPTPAFADITTGFWIPGSILCHLILKID